VDGTNYALYGQEANGSTWALCMMNMFLHNVNVSRDNIRWGDTLNDPQLVEGPEELRRFNVVVANPPFSLDKWGAENAGSDKFKRFQRGIPPKSKGDYAFISHMIESSYLEPSHNGRVGVIVPHGVLFRGGSEGTIRQRLIEENLLDAVIGLPPNLFYGTGIPAAILLFRRRKRDDSVIFIDASRDFAAGTNQNTLREEDIEKIRKAYQDRQDVHQYAHLVTKAEIAANNYNLNMPRYVDTFEAAETIDLASVNSKIMRLRSELMILESQMQQYLEELGLDG
jgi:type I restriction enzyme M protein